MTSILTAVALISAAWVFYTFVGYPLLVWGLAALKRPRDVSAGALPRTALLISAYNEAETIAAKLENALALEYPPDLLEIWVSSDGSTDRTNEIVRRVQATQPRVRLAAHRNNLGKTSALMATLDQLDGEIDVVVFSDANAMYEPKAVQVLVDHFADDGVGCVAGDLTYGESGPEGTYRRYENWIKRSESRLGTCLVAEGSIFATRRELIPRVSPDQVEDIAIPLSIALRGYRVIYEGNARSIESFRLTWHQQFRRRRRIVNRSIRTLVAFPAALNPIHHPMVALMLFSHRLMRWLAPLAIAIGASAALVAAAESLSPDLDVLAFVLFGSVLAGAITSRSRRGRQALSLIVGFIVANAAIVAGLASALRGTRIETWKPARIPTDSDQLFQPDYSPLRRAEGSDPNNDP